MGDKVEPRRKWIENNVEFSLEDDQSILENENMISQEARDI
ncbi:DNA topoisomerase IV subunit B [Listeria fleischmannii subsp. coloradonensis]|nr:DNA topoisomerase IV subunit B [Listeria fleischmannii subsp. coloradonensis]